MEIIYNNTKQNIRILTYFKYGNSSTIKEFVLYTKDIIEQEKSIYLAELIEEKLVLPNKEDLLKIKKLIENFISKDFELSIVLKNKFEYLEKEKIENKTFNEISNKKIVLTKDQYIKLISNKYLTYPKMEILNIDEITKEGYDKNNKDAIAASVLTLLIYIIGIIIFQIILSFNRVPINTLFKPNGPSIIVWSLVIALISMVAFNFEEKKSIESWVVIFIITILFTLIISLIEGNIKISELTLNTLIYSLIFAVPYVIAKKISFKIVNRLKCRNYVTYYCFYLLPFATILLILINLYNKVFINYITNIINMM